MGTLKDSPVMTEKVSFISCWMHSEMKNRRDLDSVISAIKACYSIDSMTHSELLSRIRNRNINSRRAACALYKCANRLESYLGKLLLTTKEAGEIKSLIKEARLIAKRLK